MLFNYKILNINSTFSISKINKSEVFRNKSNFYAGSQTDETTTHYTRNIWVLTTEPQCTRHEQLSDIIIYITSNV